MNATPSDRDRGRPAQQRQGGFLRALASDTGGNTLAMMAAFLIPLAALSGSAVDMSRAYLVKVRLQQACDAGVLAGRKVMTVTSGTTLDAVAPNGSNSASTPTYNVAKAFFDNNFQTGWMQTTGVAFTPSRSTDGQVLATATATMPMAIMGMFGFGAMQQSVNCTARLDVGDTDIMFVLDTTGSMACVTGSGCSSITTYTREDGTQGYYRVELANSKIAGVRTAVSTFYTTLAAAAPATAHIRYGFVPYASSINVGALITDNSAAASGMPVNPGNPAYIVDSWTYQSRQPFPGPAVVAGGIASDVTNGSATIVSSTTTTSALCSASAGRTPVASTNPITASYNTSGNAVIKTFSSWKSGANNCKLSSQPVKIKWQYDDLTYNVSNFKAFSATVVDPTKAGAPYSPKWQGCIEERNTTASTSFSQNSLPADLDPDLVPTSNATRWKPMWPEAVYYRPANAASTSPTGSTSASGDSTNSSAGDDYTSLAQSFNITANYYACGKAAQRLETMTLAEVQAYVAASGDFRALGYTYHDVGMIWGLRLLSPDGIWKADTAAWPGNNPPNRYIVFMSDGALQTNTESYGTYGVEKLDKRITGSTIGNDDSNHNARFQAVCTAAKAKNITVFVVAFDTALTTDMSNCASPGYAYTASDSAALNTAFASIARQVAKLRLSQ